MAWRLSWAIARAGGLSGWRAPVFVMRYATWISKLAPIALLLGKPFNLNGVSWTLVGIAAPRFVWGGGRYLDAARPTGSQGGQERTIGSIGVLSPGLSMGFRWRKLARI